MRTIAVAVAILSACFMQEVVTQETDVKLHLTETATREKLNVADEVQTRRNRWSKRRPWTTLMLFAEKLDARAEELYKEAHKVGASAEARKAAEVAQDAYTEHEKKVAEQTSAAIKDNEDEKKETEDEAAEEDDEEEDEEAGEEAGEKDEKATSLVEEDNEAGEEDEEEDTEDAGEEDEEEDEEANDEE